VSNPQSSYNSGSAHCGCYHDPSNDATALKADAGVEEGGARSVDVGGRGARRPSEEPSSSGTASEMAAHLQPPKKKRVMLRLG
jgi:hypothetical protein